MSATTTTTTLPYGLEWDDDAWGSCPHFSVEPDLSIIKTLVRRHLNVEPSTKCKVSVLAKEKNKVYKVEILSPQVRTYVMKVALPLDTPNLATMSFLRKHTDAPIPMLYAYDSANENELQLSWILMEFINGQPLNQSRWKTLSVENKIILAKTLAGIYAQHSNIDSIRWGVSITRLDRRSGSY